MNNNHAVSLASALLLALCSCTAEPSEGGPQQGYSSRQAQAVDTQEQQPGSSSPPACGFSLDITRPVAPYPSPSVLINDLHIKLKVTDAHGRQLEFRGPPGYAGQEVVSLTADHAPEGTIWVEVDQAGLVPVREAHEHWCDPTRPVPERRIVMQPDGQSGIPLRCAFSVAIMRPVAPAPTPSFLTEHLYVSITAGNPTGEGLTFRGPNGYAGRDPVELTADEAPEGAIWVHATQPGLVGVSRQYEHSCDPMSPQPYRQLEMTVAH